MAIHRIQQDTPIVTFSPPEEDFGTFIERIRRRSRIQIQEVVALFSTYLNEQSCGKKWDRFTYSHLINDRKRRPRFEELLPLYKCLVLSGVHFSASERNHYLFLAWQVNEKPQTDTPFPVQGQWALLLNDFADFDQLPLIAEGEQIPQQNERSTLHLVPPLQEERRHLVGRDQWVHEMQRHVSDDLPKKLVVIQAALGAGKSSALHLLRRSLEERDHYYPFFFTCASPVNMTAEEYLDRFLGDTFVSFGIKGISEENKQLSFSQRTQLLLEHVAQMNRQTILFVDNGEVLLQDQGQLAACWQQFFLEFVEYQHHATIFFATRKWPGGIGRKRTFFVLNKLPPLSPEAGAAIWQRMGFDDVTEHLLRQVSVRCGGNPWLIELRASTLQDMPLDSEDEIPFEPGKPQDNAHTQLIKRLLLRPRMFGREADRETQRMLQEVISMHLSPQAHVLLEILACSPLPIPLYTLMDFIPHVEDAFEELQHASLVDQDTKIYGQRAQLLPVVSEAAIHRLITEERKDSLEELVTQVYTQWLKQGIQSDQEKCAVVAELIVYFLTHQRLLDAAERLLRFSWLLVRFGHVSRIARLAHHIMEHEPWRITIEQECGGLLLRYHLSPFLGQKMTAEARMEAYQHIYTALLQEQVQLQVPTELYIVHQLIAFHRDRLQFQKAEVLLNEMFERHPTMKQTHPHRFASLLGRRAALLGTWSEYADEQKQHEQANMLREQAIAAFRQCISLWEQCEEREPATKRSNYKYRRARHLNDLGHYLRVQGMFNQALDAIEQSLDLKNAGYVEPGSFATSYGEKAQCFAATGQFRKALHFDELAVGDIQQAATSGNSLLQEDIGIYLVERGILYMLLGKLKEAESLLQQASTTISDDRRSYRIQAQEALVEIQQWRQVSPNEQLDWRWSARYRKIVRYDPFKWLTPAAFNPAEEEEWRRLRSEEGNEQQQKRREDLITQSRDREIISALNEQREPQFQYPSIPITEVTGKIAELRTLATNIEKGEPNAVVRRLYLDAIGEQLSYLLMIKATYEGNTQGFRQHNRAIHAEPTPDEMGHALTYVAQLISRGRQRTDTVEVSDQLAQFLRSIQAPLTTGARVNRSPVIQNKTSGIPIKTRTIVTPATIRRFFDTVMQDYGFTGWHTIIDSTAHVARIEQLTQELILPDKPLSVESVRDLLSHEIESHVFRAASGAMSCLDLLATGTCGFLTTEEGLALYYDRKTAQLQGKEMDEFTVGSLFGTLSTGLASGVLTSPLTFSQLYTFLELLLILYRTVNGLDKDMQRARAKAPNLARLRCLRTFRGVPDLTVAGVAYLKDAIYYRGEQQVMAAIEQDKQKLTRLMVGVVGLEQLGDLEELGITEPPHQPKWLAHDPDLAKYILSFEITRSDRLQA
jgi:tetratricopeptide (TPR) repeat protein